MSETRGIEIGRITHGTEEQKAHAAAHGFGLLQISARRWVVFRLCGAHHTRDYSAWPARGPQHTYLATDGVEYGPDTQDACEAYIRNVTDALTKE